MKGIKNSIFVVLLFITFQTIGKEAISYRLSMPEPHTHYFEVEMTLEDFNEKSIDVKIPVWAPGSYLVREFAKNIEVFAAKDSDGNDLESYKIDKNTWRIEKGNSKLVKVRYNVYAYEMSVRTSFLDADHGYLNGTSVFMYVDQYKDVPSKLVIDPYEEWKVVSTGLPKIDEGEWAYLAEDYDQLVDCPIEIGNHKEIAFEVAGIPHTIAMYGPGNYDEEKLKTDFTRIINGLTEIFGSNPNENYVFIVHNLTKGDGGLEHKNSTTLNVNRWTYAPWSSYKSFLGLVAHEYFHLWLVKRIRPVELGPFNYDEENYTSLLWVMEGFTSYFSQLILCHLGYIQEYDFIKMLSDNYTAIESSPGNDIQPVSMASFDAWIKAYRPNENSGNATISYYQKGMVLGSLLDVLIVAKSEGQHNLGDVLRDLYGEIYLKTDKGITEEDMKQALEKYSKTNLDEFFDHYVNGSEEIDYTQFLSLAGLNIEKKVVEEDKISLGLSLSDSGGKTVVKRVTKNSPGWKYGINVDDEIIAVDGFRVNSSEIKKILRNKEFGEQISVLVSRDNILKTLKVTLEETDSFYFHITQDKNSTKQEDRILTKWLKN